MLRLACLLLLALSSACASSNAVSPAEFQRLHAEVGMAQTAREVAYLGQKDGRVYLRVSSMRLVGRGWSHRIVHAPLASLDPDLRGRLPAREHAP